MTYVRWLYLFVLTLTIVTTRAFEWISQPDIVYACAKGDAYFPWSYDEQRYQIQLVYYRYLKSDHTVLGYHIIPDKELNYYTYSKDRVSLMDPDVANVGLILKKVTKEDQGMYVIEMSTPGKDDEAELRVYYEAELTPTIQLNNREISFDSKLNATGCHGCILVVTTAHALSADVKITSGTSNVECKQKTTCSLSLDLQGHTDNVMKIRIRIDYGFCDKFINTLDVIWTSTIGEGAGTDASQGEKPDQSAPSGLGPKTSLIIGVVIGCLLTIIVVLVFVIVFVFRRYKRRHSRGQELSRRQDIFLNTMNKWQGAVKRTKAKRSNSRSPEAVESGSAGIQSGSDTSPVASNRDEEDGAQFDPLMPKSKLTDEPYDRPPPDGTDGPSDFVDPDPDVERQENTSPSTEEAVEVVEDGVVSDNSDYDRMESVDSAASTLRSYVVVPDKDKGEEKEKGKGRQTDDEK